jgi:hypothetical protein
MKKQTKKNVKLTANDRLILAGLLEQVASDLGGSYGRELDRIRRKVL